MDPFTSLVLSIVATAVAFYVLYWVIRKAVAGGIRDFTDNAGPKGGSGETGLDQEG